MGCEHELELMMQALDGELDQAGMETLQAHLAGCPECSREWTRLQALERVLADAPSLAAPDGLLGTVMTSIERQQRTVGLWGWLALAAGAAALLAVALLPSVGAALGLGSSPLVALHAWDTLLYNIGRVVAAVFDSLWLTAGALFVPLLLLAFCGLGMSFVTAPMLLWAVKNRPVAPRLSVGAR